MIKVPINNNVVIILFKITKALLVTIRYIIIVVLDMQYIYLNKSIY